MKRIIILTLMLTIAMNAIPAMAQRFAPNPTPQPTAIPDTDGDGIPDTDDHCPTVAGVREQRGCPPPADPNPQPPSLQPLSEPEHPSEPAISEPAIEVEQPFVPPLMPNDRCYITPLIARSVNVRNAPEITADIIGSLAGGQMYVAHGYVEPNGERWYALTTYDGYTEPLKVGFASERAVNGSNCRSLLPPAESGSEFDPATDYSSPDGGSPTLCHLQVGYDAATWGGDSNIPWAAFWFEYEPGAPLPAGTKAWGVISLAPHISLLDNENIFAVAPNIAQYEEAVNSGYGGTYGWPTLAGGINSGGHIMFRMTNNNQSGACGPIVGIDDLMTSDQ